MLACWSDLSSTDLQDRLNTSGMLVLVRTANAEKGVHKHIGKSRSWSPDLGCCLV